MGCRFLLFTEMRIDRLHTVTEMEIALVGGAMERGPVGATGGAPSGAFPPPRRGTIHGNREDAKAGAAD